MNFYSIDLKTWPRAQMFYIFLPNGAHRLFPHRFLKQLQEEMDAFNPKAI